jgi:predicted dehydrogenase
MKIGIMSFAHLHAEAYIQNLRAIPGVELIGLADEDVARGQRYAQQFGAPFFPSYESLLAAMPAGVLVCSENSKHRHLVEMAAGAGVHMLSEKPLATSLEDAQAMIDACDRAGVKLMTAFPMRFSAPLSEVKARLDAGELGQVYCFNSTNQGELPKRHRAWFVDPKLAGGGAVLDHTVHLVDIMRWYLGSEVVEVYCQTNKIFHADEVEVETGGLLMLSFANGVFASIDCSWSKPDYYPTWGGLTFEMVTERGAVQVDAFKQNLTVYSQSLQRPVWAHWGSDSNQAMLEEFVASIREDRPPKVTGLDGYRALEVALAAYSSAQSGHPEHLDNTTAQ